MKTRCQHERIAQFISKIWPACYMQNGYCAYNKFVPHTYENMNQLILLNELDFSTTSTKGRKLLNFRNQLFVCKKRTRDVDGQVSKCYWYCLTKACPGAVTYLVDVTNAAAIEDGTGIALDYVGIIRCYFYCITVTNFFTQLVLCTLRRSWNTQHWNEKWAWFLYMHSHWNWHRSQNGPDRNTSSSSKWYLFLDKNNSIVRWFEKNI